MNIEPFNNPAQLIKKFQQLLNSNDKQSAFQLVAPDAVWHSDEIEAPWSGVHRGKAAIIRHFRAISGTTENFSRNVEQFIENDDSVVEIGSLKCVFKKNKQPFATDYVCIYKVRNNQIYYYRIFEDSLKLRWAYFPENVLQISDAISLGCLFREEDDNAYIFSLLKAKGIPFTVLRSVEELRHFIENDKQNKIVIGSGESASTIWPLIDQPALSGVILLHPANLPQFTTQLRQCPCLIVHASNTSLTSTELLQSINRPRPDIVQFIEDDIVSLLPVILKFINQFGNVRQQPLAQVVRHDAINSMLPAAFPGAIRIITDENCIVGFVKPDNYPSFPHINYRDEVHYILSGNARFRHGDQPVQEIKSGDVVFVKAFELHEWFDYSPDFMLLYVQCKSHA
jgi:ketosteroid isomerase-like protein/mannose-6-phosphate isomerase-like protein (cupin superfamily)